MYDSKVPMPSGLGLLHAHQMTSEALTFREKKNVMKDMRVYEQQVSTSRTLPRTRSWSFSNLAEAAG